MERFIRGGRLVLNFVMGLKWEICDDFGEIEIRAKVWGDNDTVLRSKSDGSGLR